MRHGECRDDIGDVEPTPEWDSHVVAHPTQKQMGDAQFEDLNIIERERHHPHRSRHALDQFTAAGVIAIDDGEIAESWIEQLRFGLEVPLHRTVEIEMVDAEIREDHGRETDTVDASHLERMR